MSDENLFKNFPVIGPEFNIIRIDVMRFKNEDGEGFSYNPMIIFLNTDTEKLKGGMTLLTNSYYDDMKSVEEFVFELIKMKLFFGDVHSGGTIYNETMERVGEIDWNEIIVEIVEDRFHDKLEYSTNIDPNRVLH